jgi:hypothetical protein
MFILSIYEVSNKIRGVLKIESEEEKSCVRKSTKTKNKKTIGHEYIYIYIYIYMPCR